MRTPHRHSSLRATPISSATPYVFVVDGCGKNDGQKHCLADISKTLDYTTYQQLGIEAWTQELKWKGQEGYRATPKRIWRTTAGE